MKSNTPQRVEFFVVGRPFPKARARTTRRITYTPKTTRLWERDIVTFFQQQCRGVFFDKQTPLRFSAEIICSGTGDLASIRGDADNYLKSCLDALNGLAFYDDIQIVELKCVKRRRRRGEQLGALIRIEVFKE